jgi:arabinan endo-1,5-alpha-L-arabinosidase
MLCSLLAGGTACLTPRAGWAEGSINDRMTGAIAPTHDPCIIKAHGRFHLFSTGPTRGDTAFIPWRTSTDLVSWTAQGGVFESVPQWARDAVPGTRGMWAPDIAYFNGEYHLYYSCSTFGSNRSVIGLATTASLDQDAREWRDRGLVVRSEPGDDFNAIDPNHIQDREGHHWLAFGSFWSGIKLIRLDPQTGKPPAGAREMHLIATRPAPQGAPRAIEAPFIFERGGYYYLFVAFDYCCKRESSTYYVVVGRSRDIRGPYTGQDGKSMLDGYGTVVLQGNRRYRGPGHPAVLRDGDRDYLVYHAYDSEQEGKPVLRISPLVWTAQGWPSAQL